MTPVRSSGSTCAIQAFPKRLEFRTDSEPLSVSARGWPRGRPGAMPVIGSGKCRESRRKRQNFGR